MNFLYYCSFSSSDFTALTNTVIVTCINFIVAIRPTLSYYAIMSVIQIEKEYPKPAHDLSQVYLL